MRILEILIPITLAIYILWPLFTAKENNLMVNLIPVLSIVLVVLHLIFEGYRWQMIPLYAMTVIIFLITVPELIQPTSGEFERMSSAGAGLIGIFIVVAITTALPALLPVPELPTPGGQYSVGTQTFVLTDESRQEQYSDQDEPRKFMIQVWYPANPNASDQHAPWMRNATIYGRAISNYLGMPGFFLDHLALTESPAWMDAPVANTGNGFPVILFSHGWNGFAAQNTGQALELASRGYVVVALEHTYGAVVTVFPDGETIYNKPSALPKGTPEPGYTEAARKLAEQWSQDIAFTLDYLSEQNQDSSSLFYSNLDLSRTGLYGHSTGGGAVIQFCGTDPRCTALLGMDPFMSPISKEILESGLSQTAIFMFSQEWYEDAGSANNRLFKQFFENFDSSSHAIGIRGTTHYDFSDMPMLSPIAAQLGLKGPIDGERVTEIVNTYLTIFFNQTLKDYPTDLFDEALTDTEIVNLDYLRSAIRPIRLTMPGGQVYHLGEGQVDHGEWVPLRAEWLVGTEISRWVALPWSSRLETILETLNSGDQIELTMSNSDVVVYEVTSIQKMSMDELLASNPTRPSLLIVLFNDNEEEGTSWVITALP